MAKAAIAVSMIHGKEYRSNAILVVGCEISFFFCVECLLSSSFDTMQYYVL